MYVKMKRMIKRYKWGKKKERKILKEIQNERKKEEDNMRRRSVS